jgi:Ni/Fe-hydrogenase subunit HybB-like protein
MALVLLTITPSLKGFFIGLSAGGFVLAALAAAFIILSQADRFR